MGSGTAGRGKKSPDYMIAAVRIFRREGDVGAGGGKAGKADGSDVLFIAGRHAKLFSAFSSKILRPAWFHWRATYDKQMHAGWHLPLPKVAVSVS